MAEPTENQDIAPANSSTEQAKEQQPSVQITDVHDKPVDVQKDNFSFISGFEKFTVPERQKLVDQAAEWGRNGDLDLFRSAGLPLDRIKKQPMDRHHQLAAMFLKRQPGSDTSFQVSFNGNDYAETQVDLSDILPANILKVDVYDAENKIFFTDAERSFKDGKPGYFTADGKQVYLREGFTIKVKGSQSSLALDIPKFGKQTYENALKEQIYLTENAQKTELKKKVQEEAGKQGKTLITTPEFYDKSLTEVTRSPKLEDIFKDGKFDFSKIMEQIQKFVSEFGVMLSAATSDFTKKFDKKEEQKQAQPIPASEVKPSAQDIKPAPQTLANPSKYEALPANERDRQVVQVARGFLGSKDFRTPDVAGGNLACAKVASSILKEAGVLNQVVLGVDGVEAELLRKGWQKHSSPAQAGDVVIWGRTPSRMVDGIAKPGHRHVGVMTGAEYAVNNSSNLKTPVETKVDFNSPRGVYLLSPPHRYAGKADNSAMA